MARGSFFAGSSKILKASLGSFLVVFYIYLLFQTYRFVPADQVDTYFKIFVCYSFMLALGFALPDARASFFKVPVFTYLPRFALSFGVFLFLFFVVLARVDPFGATALSIFSAVPWWLKIIHATVFALIENAFFIGYLTKTWGVLAASFTAGLFHYGVWEGSAFFVIPAAGLLFLAFSYVHYRFKRNENDFSVVDGCHTAYNFVKLGMFLSGSIV